MTSVDRFDPPEVLVQVLDVAHSVPVAGTFATASNAAYRRRRRVLFPLEFEWTPLSPKTREFRPPKIKERLTILAAP